MLLVPGLGCSLAQRCQLTSPEMLSASAKSHGRESRKRQWPSHTYSQERRKAFYPGEETQLLEQQNT